MKIKLSKCVFGDVAYGFMTVKELKGLFPVYNPKTLNHENTVFPGTFTISAKDFVLDNDELVIKRGFILDGNRRIKLYLYDDIEVPVTIFLGMSAQNDAYVYSVINSHIRNATASKLYSIFEISSSGTNYRSHIITRCLNEDDKSPVKGLLNPSSVSDITNEKFETLIEILMGTTFTKWTRKKKHIFLKPTYDPDDSGIYRVLLNALNAAKQLGLDISDRSEIVKVFNKLPEAVPKLVKGHDLRESKFVELWKNEF